eukprot:gb/GECG01003788.1/.p1 GENE.gb/GECG01003788.1/~~gb/GECG01003788.1/.p1  ORF type:complete len:1015 (+),score=117.37 gb/GECG01003788.1/:1-3045(+)
MGGYGYRYGAFSEPWRHSNTDPTGKEKFAEQNPKKLVLAMQQRQTSVKQSRRSVPPTNALPVPSSPLGENQQQRGHYNTGGGGGGFPPRAPTGAPGYIAFQTSKVRRSWETETERYSGSEPPVSASPRKHQQQQHERLTVGPLNYPVQAIRSPSRASDPPSNGSASNDIEEASASSRWQHSSPETLEKTIFPSLKIGSEGEYAQRSQGIQSPPDNSRSHREGTESEPCTTQRSAQSPSSSVYTRREMGSPDIMLGDRPGSAATYGEDSEQHPQGCLCIVCYENSVDDSSGSEHSGSPVPDNEDEEPEGEMLPNGSFPEESQQEAMEGGGHSEETITLVQSLFAHRPPTVFFDYPKFVGISRARDCGAVFRTTGDNLQVKFKISVVHEYNAVRNAWTRNGFTRGSGKNWNALWSCHLKEDELARLNPFQKVNHFPGTWAIGRKDRLARSMGKMYRNFGEDYNVIPRTYLLPGDRGALKRELSQNPRCMWILKPVASSCGRGIRLVSGNIMNHKNRRSGPRRSTSEHTGTLGNALPPKSKKYVAQQYIKHPHLIDGRKYDLRLYVLVTSFDPLRVYLFNDGLVRFCTEGYSTSCKNGSVTNRYAHLTNYSVNKRSSIYDRNEDSNNDGQGSKWSLKALRRYFKDVGIDDVAVMNDIKDVVIKTLISCESEVGSAYNRAFSGRNPELGTGTPAFEIFGFDVLLDKSLKPWLMEVNVSPSLSSSSPLDKKIKCILMTDVFHLIGIVPYDAETWSTEVEKQKQSRLVHKEWTMTMPTSDAVVAAAAGNSRDKGFGSSAKRPVSRPTSASCRITIADLESGRCRFDSLTASERALIFDLEDEWSRKGNFEVIFPTRKTWKNYKKYFESKRKSNVLMDIWLTRWRSGVLGDPQKRLELFHDPKRAPVKAAKTSSPNRTSFQSNDSWNSSRESANDDLFSIAPVSKSKLSRYKKRVGSRYGLSMKTTEEIYQENNHVPQREKGSQSFGTNGPLCIRAEKGQKQSTENTTWEPVRPTTRLWQS